MSPSLRGSGLKLEEKIEKEEKTDVSLFTREWIEIKLFQGLKIATHRLPLYEGVD